MSNHTCSLGISSTKLVGFTGDNPDICAWYQNPRFWATPRAYQPNQVKLSMSPAFSTAQYWPGKLVTWGDFLALGTSKNVTNATADIALARISDWKIRKLIVPAQSMPHSDAFTLTDKYLYIGFVGTGPNMENDISTVRRYDLTQFESFTVPFE